MWVIHLQIEGLYARSEILRDPSLEGRPFLLMAGNRVGDLSPEAARAGVKVGQKKRHALQISPKALGLDLAVQQAEELFIRFGKTALNHTPLVEPLGFHRLWIRLGPGQEPVRIFEDILRECLPEVGHHLRAGIASSRFMARTALLAGLGGYIRRVPSASYRVFRRPGGTAWIVVSGREQDFLAPLPVVMLWPLSRETLARLRSLGLESIGDVARVGETEMYRRFGPEGRLLLKYARGMDSSPVRPDFPPREEVAGLDFDSPTTDRESLRRGLCELSRQLQTRLRSAGEGCLRLRLILFLDARKGQKACAETTRTFERLVDAGRLGAVLAGLLSSLEVMEPVSGMEVRAGFIGPIPPRQSRLAFPGQDVCTGSPALPGRPGTACERFASDSAGFDSLLKNLRRRFPGVEIRMGRDWPASRRERMLSFWDPYRFSNV